MANAIPCMAEGCTNPARTRGICDAHFTRYKRGTLDFEPLAPSLHRALSVDAASGMGVCAVCGPTRFRIRPGRSVCWHIWLQEKAKNAARDKTPKPRCPQEQRAKRLWREYQMTPSEWSQRVLEQGGLCAVCRMIPRGKKGFVVDHCHTTGKVRALLCAPCNSALGLFQDDPERCVLAADYLRVHSGEVEAA